VALLLNAPALQSRVGFIHAVMLLLKKLLGLDPITHDTGPFGDVLNARTGTSLKSVLLQPSVVALNTTSYPLETVKEVKAPAGIDATRIQYSMPSHDVVILNVV
jgi:hypothetical protein